MRRLRSDDAEPQNLVEGEATGRRRRAHSWAEIEARGRTIREDFAAEYGLTLPLVAIDLGRWDKGDGPFEAVAR